MRMQIIKLAADFRRWGATAAKRVRSGVKKWGVIFDEFDNGNCG